MNQQNQRLELSLKVCTQRELTSYAELYEYVGGFSVPSSATSVQPLLNADQARNNLKDTKFACGCSDFLTLAPMLARFLREVVSFRGGAGIVESMIACLDTIELLQAVRRGACTPEELGVAIAKPPSVQRHLPIAAAPSKHSLRASLAKLSMYVVGCIGDGCDCGEFSRCQ